MYIFKISILDTLTQMSKVDTENILVKLGIIEILNELFNKTSQKNIL